MRPFQPKPRAIFLMSNLHKTPAMLQIFSIASMFVLVFACSLATETPDFKRLVLHSEQDMALRITQLEATVASLQSKIETLDSHPAAQGSVYVRWGKNTCPSSAELVYKGYTAGKKWDQNGGGTDNLCLPEQPAWGKYHDGNDSIRSYIYGTEVDYIDDGDHIYAANIFNQDMPCAVCRTSNPTNVMIPARNICYPGWTLEYTGYLFAEVNNPNHYAFDHLCLDEQPDYLQHGAAGDDQHILYLVEGKCGSLPCPPYVDGRELTCVVCSK